MQVIIGDPIDPGYLSKFEKKYDDEKTKGYVSKETRFQYAWCLIRSNNTDDIKKGIVLLDPKEDPKAIKGDHRYILFYLSVAYYKLNEYEKALRFIRALLRSEPENKQALDMEKLVNKALMNDGLFGMAIVGAIGLAVAGLACLVTFAVAK